MHSDAQNSKRWPPQSDLSRCRVSHILVWMAAPFDNCPAPAPAFAYTGTSTEPSDLCTFAVCTHPDCSRCCSSACMRSGSIECCTATCAALLVLARSCRLACLLDFMPLCVRCMRFLIAIALDLQRTTAECAEQTTDSCCGGGSPAHRALMPLCCLSALLA